MTDDERLIQFLMARDGRTREDAEAHLAQIGRTDRLRMLLLTRTAATDSLHSSDTTPGKSE